MAELESSVEMYLRKEIKRMGGICDKFASPSNTGVPDRIVIYKGRVVFVELKRDGEKPRKLQAWQHERYRLAGAEVVTLEGREDAKKFIEDLKKGV